MERGANITLRSDDGTTPLHLAASSGHVAAIRFLLDKGADIHARTKCSSMPLHQAAQMGRLEAAPFLLENGAEIDARDEDGRTPLHSVVWSVTARRRPSVVQGADIETVDAKGMTPLQNAVAFGNSEEVIDCLLTNSANVEVTDRDGRNLLQLG